MPATTCRADRRVELAAGKIVEEKQWLGALHDKIVDRHGDQIDADRVVAGGLDRDLDLGADAVGGGHQDRIGKAGGLEVEQAAKAADFGAGAWARRQAHQRLDQFHHAVAGIDIDAGRRVARLIHGATNRTDHPSRQGRDCSAPPTSESPGAQARARRYIGWLNDGAPEVGVEPTGTRVALDSNRLGSGWKACREPGHAVSIPNLITLGRIILVPDRGLGDHVGRDAHRLSVVPGGRDQRCRRWLPRQALPHGERAWRLSRSAGRQGADRVDLCFARHRRRAADLPGHPRRVARHHDHRRVPAGLAGRTGRCRSGRCAISKVNTVAQILLATLVLAEQGFGFDAALLSKSPWRWSPS